MKESRTSDYQTSNGLWVKFKELESSIFSLCKPSTKRVREKGISIKTTRQNVSFESGKRERNTSNADNTVRKSRRTAFPTQKKKEQDNVRKC